MTTEARQMNQHPSRIRLFAVSLALAAVVGCAAPTSEPEPSGEGRVGTSEQALLAGGCSNSQIRTLQAGCRESCPNGSAGIDHCYPGTMTAGANVFLDTSEGGICVCN
jgi:hypothetical protein